MRREIVGIRFVRGGAIALILLVLSAGAAVIVHNRTREIQQEAAHLATIGAVLSEQTTRSIESVRLVVADVAAGLAAAAPGDASQLQFVAGTVAFHDILRGRAAGIPQLDAITVIDASGRLVNFSRFLPVPAINVSDRDYFQALRDRSDIGDFLSAPVENRGSGTWTIYLARRLNTPDGRFLGLVLGAMQLNYFENFYSKVQIGDGGTISLWRDDGTLLARYPSLPIIGTHRDRGDLFHVRPGEQRTMQSSNTVDGEDRLLVASRLVSEPLVVITSRTMAAVLADWRSDSFVVAGATGACALMIFATMLFLTRQLRAYGALQDALVDRDAAERGRRDAEAQLVQAQKLEAMGRVAAGVAHDFNNLLMVVLSNAELLALTLPANTAAAQRIATIGQAVDRGAQLTQQMLAFSRQQILTPRAVDLNVPLDGIDALLRSSLGGHVSLERRPAAGLWPVHVDAGQVEHAILNLVINARDAMPDGGMVVVATRNRTLAPGETVGLLGAGDYVEVSVADTGTGMTPDVLARAFDPFFTTKGPGHGSGLGLSQVFGFVRQSRGDVVVESVPGRGTTIRILLPRAGEAPAPIPAEPVVAVGVSAEPPAPPPAIVAERTVPEDSVRSVVLVVDDDEAVREAVIAMLEEDSSLDIAEADSGAAALRVLAEDGRIRLMLTDFAMPGMTGAELAERARDGRPDLQVVFMTGYARPEPLESERWVLRKPFTVQILTDAVHEAITAA